MGFAGLSFIAANGPPVLPGSPLAGLSATELELFRDGREEFLELEGTDEGLGPAFNGNSCAVCHSAPAVGGVSTITETRAGYLDEDGNFEELNGGTLYHLFSTPPHLCQEHVPQEANVIARRAVIPLFGAGLVEAIPDDEIIALEDPDDRNGDGIRGRAARIVDVSTGRDRIGRFGWKAQHATLLAFSGDAYRNEMGITNDIFPEEMSLGFDAEQLKACGSQGGIEDVRHRTTGLRNIDSFANFMKFLAPLERGPIDDTVRSGEAIFRRIGCASCHVPTLKTEPSSNHLFDRKSVPLFSDLLLHDIGTGDNIPQEAAKGNEIRTPALWGLRFRRPLLHDGRAATPEAAIQLHANEASRVTDRFDNLSLLEQRQLLAFLNSL